MIDLVKKAKKNKRLSFKVELQGYWNSLNGLYKRLYLTSWVKEIFRRICNVFKAFLIFPSHNCY